MKNGIVEASDFRPFKTWRCRYCSGKAEQTGERWDGLLVWVCQNCKRRMVFNFENKLVEISSNIKPRRRPSRSSVEGPPDTRCESEEGVAPQT